MATATNNEIVESGDEVHKYTLLLLLSLFLLSISYMSVISSSFLALYVSQLNGFVCVTTITCIRACSTYVYVCALGIIYIFLSLSLSILKMHSIRFLVRAKRTDVLLTLKEDLNQLLTLMHSSSCFLCWVSVGRDPYWIEEKWN